MSHRPRFFLRAQAGECGGQQWIYDGEEPIALLETRTVDRAEQILRYFNLCPRPINLRHLRLRPGGRRLVSGVQMFWKLTGDVVTTELMDVSVKGDGTDRLRLTVVACDVRGVATSRRLMTLTYDEGMESYVYDFECHLDVHSPDSMPGDGVGRFEYSDPWYVDIPAPAVKFPGMWEKRPFTHILCERPDGTVHKMPLNHTGIGKVSASAVCAGGLLLPVFDAGNNPAIEFVGETAEQSRIEVCPWGYDVHMMAEVQREGMWGPIFRQFRVFCCPDERARALMDAAEPVAEIEHGGMTVLPLYERSTSFDEPCRLNEPPAGEVDAWPWMPKGEGLSYEQEFGRSDDYSLKISKATGGLSMWHMDHEGEGGFMEAWPAWTGLRVTGYVKTEGVTGRGSCMGLQWMRYNQPQVYPRVYSERLTGTNDWTEVSVEFFDRHPDDCNGIGIGLVQDGGGTTWFDDLEVEVLGGR